MPVFSTNNQNCFRRTSKYNQTKTICGMFISTMKIKLSLFTNNKIVYLEKSKINITKIYKTY